LVLEEMRRVLCFLEWKGTWWEIQGVVRTDVTTDVAAGLQAHAAKQAQICHDLASSFAAQWHGRIKGTNLAVAFPTQYKHQS
jgi:hypothetical protein